MYSIHSLSRNADEIMGIGTTVEIVGVGTPDRVAQETGEPAGYIGFPSHGRSFNPIEHDTAEAAHAPSTACPTGI